MRHRLPAARSDRPVRGRGTTWRRATFTDRASTRRGASPPDPRHRHASGVVDCSVAGACEVVAGVMPDAATFAAVAGRGRPLGRARGRSRSRPARRRTRPSATSGERSTCPDAAPERHRHGRALRRGRCGGGDRAATATRCCSPCRYRRRDPRAHHRASPVGGNYDRTPGPSDTPYGLVSIVTARRRGGLRHPRAEQQRRLHPRRLALRRSVRGAPDERRRLRSALGVVSRRRGWAPARGRGRRRPAPGGGRG